eukprot:TRINITY_DN1065_c0_g1_i6.p1 TRINITY_DN1065_c0_g1~~TRINITY_DN1065_c0_g1_i6.p1  ORF type:complete len:207 (+),score=56.03 TRINITY_DN1065_c0_g1_i6:115-735(+)
MSDDDKAYLRKHNIHVLLDTLAKEMIEARPDNPQQYVVEWLKAREAEEAKQFPETPETAGPRKHIVKVQIPETLSQVSFDVLKGLLETSSSEIVVADVRHEAIGGTITGSKHIPFEQFLKDVGSFARDWSDKKQIVLCSALSPDLDQTAASALHDSLSELGSSAVVCTLVGGLREWMDHYGSDSSLTADYNSEPWHAVQKECIQQD